MKRFVVNMAVGFCVLGLYAPVFAQDTFVVGVAPFTDPVKIEQSFTPFSEYLAEAIDMPTKLVVSKSYEEFAEDVVSGGISLGFSTTVLYVQTKEQYPEKIHYIATCLQETGGKIRAYYYGFFLVNITSPYQSLADLKGRKWGFTTKSSSSGYQYPMVFFARNDIVPDTYFAEVKFLEKHPNITDALAAWKAGAENIIDGGATWDVNLWEAEEKHGPVFRKIARVGPIPLQPMVVSEAVHQNTELTEKIKTALLEAPEAVTHTEGFPYAGWEIGSDSDFDITRKVVDFTKD